MQGRGSSTREVEEDAGSMSTGRKQHERAKEARRARLSVMSGKKARARKIAKTDVSRLCLEPLRMGAEG